MKKGIKLFVLLFAFFSIQSCGLAKNPPADDKQHRPPPTTEELFKQMDANKDAKLSLAEVKGPLKNDFSKIDTNNDGFITKQELDKAPKPDMQRPPKGQNDNGPN